MKKVPLQVHIDKTLHEQLRFVAKKQKVPQSELVRKYIYQGLEKDLGQKDPAMDIVGLGNGKIPDLAEKHDHYLVISEKGLCGFFCTNATHRC
ncbi:CopG family transcriptional regulator [Desulfofundulus sp. TPOSR]|nr:CopG family transcriptional regulator [Desulfofundulus sp. TPOSR]